MDIKKIITLKYLHPYLIVFMINYMVVLDVIVLQALLEAVYSGSPRCLLCFATSTMSVTTRAGMTTVTG